MKSDDVKTYDFYGTHYLASFLDCDSKNLTNIDNLKEIMIEAIKKCGATIINYTEKRFENDGYTILFLLTESHCSIHTYPEHNSLFTDLFTCGTSCDYKKYEEVMIQYLKPQKNVSNLVTRGEEHILS